MKKKLVRIFGALFVVAQFILLVGCSNKSNEATVPKAFADRTLETSTPNYLPWQTRLEFSGDTIGLINVNKNGLHSPNSEEALPKYSEENEYYQKFMSLVVGKPIKKITEDDYSKTEIKETKLKIEKITKKGKTYTIKTDKITFDLKDDGSNTWKMPNGTFWIVRAKGE